MLLYSKYIDGVIVFIGMFIPFLFTSTNIFFKKKKKI